MTSHGREIRTHQNGAYRMFLPPIVSQPLDSEIERSNLPYEPDVNAEARASINRLSTANRGHRPRTRAAVHPIFKRRLQNNGLKMGYSNLNCWASLLHRNVVL